MFIRKKLSINNRKLQDYRRVNLSEIGYSPDGPVTKLIKLIWEDHQPDRRGNSRFLKG